MQIAEGTTLGRYQLRHPIGHGGMAEVYLAYDESLHRAVAIKVVHHSQKDDLMRFQQEAEMASSLIHAHILPVYDYGQEDPWHYLVMPYIDNGTLADRLQTRGPLGQEEAGVVLEQIASALQHAHEQGILHRDIKPSNILLLNDTYTYLSDFGIARLMEREGDLTETGTIIGTAEYMAPELLESTASKSSDIYALGVVLYDMLVGRLPFTAPNPIAVFQKQLHEPPPSLSMLNSAISPFVEEVVFCALAKDTRQRFQTPLALAKAYQQALQTPPTPARQGKTDLSFNMDTTVAVPAVHPPLNQTAMYSAGQSAQAWRDMPFVIPGVLVLMLILFSAFAASILGNHGTQQTASQRTTTAPAATTKTSIPRTLCIVNDPAAILDHSQICQAAQNLKSSLEVTINQNRSGDNNNTSFWPQALPIPNSHTIVIDITLGQKHGHRSVLVHITGGDEVPLSNTQYHNASDAFYQALTDDGDLTTATIAIIEVLKINDA